MKRLISTIIITIFIGICFLFIKDKFFNEVEDINENITYIFNIDYAKQVSAQEITEKIENKEEVILLTGQADSQAIAKTSTFLREVVNDYNLQVYYLEDTDTLRLNSSWINNYDNLSETLGFNPVILVFQDNQFVAGLPGEVLYQNIEQFFKYTNVIKGVE